MLFGDGFVHNANFRVMKLAAIETNDGFSLCDAADGFGYFRRCICEREYRSTSASGSGTKPLARQWRLWLMFRIVPDVAHFVN